MSSRAHLSRRKQNSLSSHRKIEVNSPAKVNIYLNIIGKYRNGFHRIESIVNRVNIFDKIIIEARDDNRVEFTCSDRSLENNDNLCVRAAKLLKRELKLSRGFNIYLQKNIPVGAGLGGGSSNAAYTILGINKLLQLKLPREKLLEFGSQLGSDVNFFIVQSKWAYIKGRGDIVKPLDIQTNLNYILVYPCIKASTKLVYQKVKADLTKFLDNVSILSYALKERDYLLMEKLSFNRLEESALSVYKRLRIAKALFKKEGFSCHISGSGSTLFTILRVPPYTMNINSLVSRMKNRGFSVFTARTC